MGEKKRITILQFSLFLVSLCLSVSWSGSCTLFFLFLLCIVCVSFFFGFFVHTFYIDRYKLSTSFYRWYIFRSCNSTEFFFSLYLLLVSQFFWCDFLRYHFIRYVRVLCVFIEFRCCTFHDLSQSQEMNNHKKSQPVENPEKKTTTTENSKARCIYSFDDLLFFIPFSFSLVLSIFCWFFLSFFGFKFVPRW